MTQNFNPNQPWLNASNNIAYGWGNQSWYWDSNNVKTTAIDYNGDGIYDAVIRQEFGTWAQDNVYTFQVWQFNKGNGQLEAINLDANHNTVKPTGDITLTPWVFADRSELGGMAAEAWYWDAAKVSVRYADFDGDGAVDTVLRREKSGTDWTQDNRNTWELFKLDKFSGFLHAQKLDSNSNSDSNSIDWAAGESSKFIKLADSKNSIACNFMDKNASISAFQPSSGDFYGIDLDNDGLTDILRMENDGTAILWASAENGSSYKVLTQSQFKVIDFNSTSFGKSSFNSSKTDLNFGDRNGDGKIDFMVRNETAGTDWRNDDVATHQVFLRNTDGSGQFQLDQSHLDSNKSSTDYQHYLNMATSAVI